MAMADWGKIGAFIVTRIDQLGSWLSKRSRRKNVQNMEKDVADNNNSTINKRVSDLKNKAKKKQYPQSRGLFWPPLLNNKSSLKSCRIGPQKNPRHWESCLFFALFLRSD